MPDRYGFDEDMKDKRIDNQPTGKCGRLTGIFNIDPYGCWWQYILDDTQQDAWIIGDYPNSED